MVKSIWSLIIVIFTFICVANAQEFALNTHNSSGLSEDSVGVVDNITSGFSNTKLKYDTVKFKNVHFISVNTGISYHVSKDEVVSPFIYSGLQSPVSLNYRYQRKGSMQTISGYYNKADLKSKVPDLSDILSHSVENYHFSLEYSYNKLFFEVPWYDLKCYAGLKFQNIINFRLHHFTNKDIEDNFEILNSLKLNFIAEKRNLLASDDYFLFSFSTPVLTYSLYNNKFNSKSYLGQLINYEFDPEVDIGYILTHGKFITFDKYFSAQTSLTYTRFFSKHVGVNISYGLLYYTFAQYKHQAYSRFLVSQCLVGLTIKL